jgi:hypothetical protein
MIAAAALALTQWQLELEAHRAATRVRPRITAGRHGRARVIRTAPSRNRGTASGTVSIT